MGCVTMASIEFEHKAGARGIRAREHCSTAGQALALTLGLALHVAAQAAMAEQPAAERQSSEAPAAMDDGGLGEVVVTANRTLQNSQSVGIAVTALSGDALEQIGIQSTSDLSIAVPGLQIAEPGSSFTSLVSIRGVSQNDFTGHLESPNSFYIDDAYQPIASTNTQPIYDVKRVEVLKGPQGTLFGVNSEGGLINVITNDPTPVFAGYVNAELGSYNEVNVQGAVGGPVAENVTGRFAFYKSNRDGYFKNTIGPDQDPDNSLGFRGKLKFDAGGRLTLLLSADYFQLRSEGAGGGFFESARPNAQGLGVHTPGQLTDYGQAGGGDPYTVSQDYAGYLNRTNYTAGVKISYDLQPITIVSQTNYGHATSYYGEDNDMSPVDYSRFFQNSQAHYLTQELRASATTGALSWTTGLYYSDIRGIYGQDFDLRGFGAAFVTDYSLNTRTEAIFGQGEYKLTDSWSLTLGARDTSDHKSFHWVLNCVAGTPTFAPAIPGGYCPVFYSGPGTEGSESPYSDSHTENGQSYRAAVNWQPTRNLLGYASYNRGYKAFNYNAGFAGFTPIALIRFKGERLNAYEVGEKWTLLGGRARLNVSAYYYDYGNYQAFDQRGLNLTLYNTPAKIKGMDAEAGLRPGAGFDLSLGGTSLRTRVDDVPLLTGLVSREAPQAPGYTLMANISNTQSVGTGQVALHFTGAWTGAQYSQLTNAPVTYIPSYFVGNARLTYAPQSRAWEVAVFSRNIFDNRSPRYAFDLSQAPLGFAERDYTLPRTYGASLLVNF
jgi:iron complex outermembrane recepter protein